MSEELLRLEHLSIEYKVRDGYLSAVNDVNCTIKKGEVLPLLVNPAVESPLQPCASWDCYLKTEELHRVKFCLTVRT